MQKKLQSLTILSLLHITSMSTPTLADKPSQQLIIAVHEFKPMIMQNDANELIGFDIDLWKAIAQKANLNYQFKKTASLPAIYSSLQTGDANVGLAGLSITHKREKKIDFSHTYLNSGLRLAVRNETTIDVSLIIKSLIRPMISFLGFILIFGHIVWFSERGQNAFSDSYFPGILESLYFVIVTGTTVGYGDYAPKKWLGRGVVVLMMLCSIVFFGWFLATISNISTESLAININSIEDIRGRKIAAKSETTSADALKKLNIPTILTPSNDQAYLMLAQGQVDMVLADSENIRYMLRQDKTNHFTVTGKLYYPQQYGIALEPNSPYRETINQALLATMEDGTYQKIVSKWFE